MTWLDDEPIRDLNAMEDKVDNLSPQSTLQVLPSFEVYTPPVTHPKEVEEIIGIPMEVEPLNETKLKEVDLNYDPKKHYGFKPGLLGHSGSLGVDFSKLGMIGDDWKLESEEVYLLRRGLNLPTRPKEVEKQDYTSMSLAEAEYVSLSAFCAQVLWLRTQLTDYGFHFGKIPMYCDSKAAIAISCNPVQHSRTKYIDVKYHFIKEHVENGIVELFFLETEYQLTDLFTKALSKDRFKYLVRRLEMRCLTPEELEVLANESS
ncbi:hypothetical protein Tco_1032322 [Tanacetum coccineum]|uniref:Retrovirus-related Pol polyprotein from transposon TNT 1-94 n=1 Tax=Tanacetum coccineum TaxID=301880 RepID=A0ABQ5GBM3_9ASTR